MKFYNINDIEEIVTFEEALLKGLGKKYGLYMIDKKDIPKFSKEKIDSMKNKSYPEIAFEVIYPFLKEEINELDLKKILTEAYSENEIPTTIQKIDNSTYILWLTNGPTYSFKDYAARFFGRILNHFLEKRNLKKVVLVATSGDTGGAIADALYNLKKIKNIVFFPKDLISEEQRRQMSTLKNNIFAFQVNGDFDICQSLVKNILNDENFSKEIFKENETFTSANSISLGRLIPQIVYPFFAYSKIEDTEKIIASIPSGNFGNMLGTIVAKEIGLPISKIICGVNENITFPEFLKTEKYHVFPTKNSPSSAMIVSHPSNVARLIALYGGIILDKRDEGGKIIKEGEIIKNPDYKKLKEDIISFSISNQEHYDSIKDFFLKHKIILDPHGAVAYKSLEKYRELTKDNTSSIIYETADPGKFPKEIEKAIDLTPDLPKRMKEQSEKEERIYSILSEPTKTENGLKLSNEQIEEAKKKIRKILLNSTQL